MNIVGFHIRGQVECRSVPSLVVDCALGSHLVTVATGAERVFACNTSCFSTKENAMSTERRAIIVLDNQL